MVEVSRGLVLEGTLLGAGDSVKDARKTSFASTLEFFIVKGLVAAGPDQ
jgi:hypothetical protein